MSRTPALCAGGVKERRGARGRGVRYTARTPEVATNGPRAAVVQLSPCVIPSWPLG
jgi:hypothetical protein